MNTHSPGPGIGEINTPHGIQALFRGQSEGKECRSVQRARNVAVYMMQLRHTFLFTALRQGQRSLQKLQGFEVLKRAIQQYHPLRGKNFAGNNAEKGLKWWSTHFLPTGELWV